MRRQGGATLNSGNVGRSCGKCNVPSQKLGATARHNGVRAPRVAIMSRGGLTPFFILILCLLFQARLTHAWAPRYYRMTHYGNKDVSLRTWVQFSEVKFYSGGTQQTVSSAVLTRGTQDGNNSPSNLIDGSLTTDFIGNLPHSARVVTVTFTLSQAAWIDSYKVYTSSTIYKPRDPKMWSLSASDDNTNFYPVHFVPDANLPDARKAETTFSIPTSMTLLRLTVNAVRNGGNEFELAEFKAKGELAVQHTAVGATGLGENYLADTSSTWENWTKTSSPVYTGPWQGADGSTLTVVHETNAIGKHLYVAFSTSNTPFARLCKYHLVTGATSTNYDPVSWTLSKVEGVSASGTPTVTVVATEANVASKIPTGRLTTSQDFYTNVCPCAPCVDPYGFVTYSA